MIYLFSKFKNVLRSIWAFLTPFRYNHSKEQNLTFFIRKLNLLSALSTSFKNKYKEELEFINTNAKTITSDSFVFPYPFSLNYNAKDINVYKDKELDLFYVLHNGKKLYYSKKFDSEDVVKKTYNSICIEQDANSPHRYLLNNFDISEDAVVIDVGAAEGNFSLDIVEKVKFIYIIEPDLEWNDALKATFREWEHKVCIINKYISNVNQAMYGRLDDLMGGIPVNFIKLDVEGFEYQALEGAVNILENNEDIKLAVCTYHNYNDGKKIEEILIKNNFNYNYSSGFMLFIYRTIFPPYFVKGLLRASKNSITH